ncbi:GNAT family N-acetyltransferase [Methylomonas sp. LL1]|nr:GNAT family N-acetyltransferase [Methylomonas sp. LL1]
MQILNLRDQSHHIPQLAAWHHHEWLALNPGRSIDHRIEYMQSYLSDDLVPSTFIAKQGILMGSAAIIENDMDTRPELTPWLASVFVAPEFRNRGIGGRLVKHVMQQAKYAGIDALYLFTPDRVSFYQKLGWRIFKQEEYRGHLVTIMRVVLSHDREKNNFNNND